MGNYYKIVNLDKRESIDPARHGRWGNKRSALFSEGHPAKDLMLCAIMGRWYRDRVYVACDEAGDGNECDYDDAGMKDITLEVLGDMVRFSDIPNPGHEYWNEQASTVIERAKESLRRMRGG